MCIRDRYMGMFKIGITGGITSGKTTLSKYLNNIPFCKTINMDKAVHKLYDIDFLLRREIEQRFGRKSLLLKPDGTTTVNRQVLGKIVFSNPDMLKALNQIVHPYAHRYLESVIQALLSTPLKSRPDVLFVEGAVIIEAGWTDYFNEVWVTTLPKKMSLLKEQCSGIKQASRMRKKGLISRFPMKNV
eukprot:TRINITY_DN16886_c0_g1_i1.p1 TRINITY_DN16886_c0_g1~~TRINITY_DN16886_c0_g1_i1.p1  ORF type:complete len:187 (+),score=18.36 TRINITY_DN16886_c0_g1_i1:149-709(+)